MPVLAFALALVTLFNILQARVISAQRDLISVLARDSFAYYSLLGHLRQKPETAAPAPPSDPRATISAKN
jgi:hypothetical protein